MSRPDEEDDKLIADERAISSPQRGLFKFVNLHMVAGGTSGLWSSISATTLPAKAEHRKQMRNKTDAAVHNKVLLLANVANCGVMHNLVYPHPQFPNVFAWTQPVWIIDVGL